MLSAKLQVAQAGAETGALLKEYLESRGVAVSRAAKPIVCYGLGTHVRPNLNGNCSLGKIERMALLTARGVPTVPWFSGANLPKDFTFPLLARKESGHGGTDIMPVFQAEEIPWRIAAGWDWFSQYVPVDTEYRVWVFQGKILDVYEKVMKRPTEYAYVAGRNFRQGFEFQVKDINKVPETVLMAGDAAVSALGFDFGAVDLLHGKDGRVYVLEVNTAPGVLRSRAEKTLAKLADCVVEWLHEL